MDGLFAVCIEPERPGLVVCVVVEAWVAGLGSATDAVVVVVAGMSRLS
jgi:hypothetical protein